jgi:DNA-binding transcriptional LysR family regulator
MARVSLPNLQDVDIRLLRVFQAVVRNRGFAAAQEDLGVTQATISNQISQLETRLGLRLCERGRSGFSLTDEGKVIFEAAQNLFRSIENFRSVVGSVRGELSGEVHFGTVDAMWTNTDLNLHRAFAAFADVAPKITVHTDIAAPQALMQGLAEDRYHLILAPAQRVPPRFRAVLAFEEHQSLYCAEDHPLFEAPDAEVTPERLSGCAYAARSYMLDWVAPLGVSFTKAAVTSHMESTALLILSGRYIGYLPAHFAAQWVEQGLMRRLLEAEASYEDKFYFAYRKREKNRAVKLLFDCMRDRV